MKTAKEIDSEVRKELIEKHDGITEETLHCGQIKANDLLKAVMTLNCGVSIRYKEAAGIHTYQIIPSSINN